MWVRYSTFEAMLKERSEAVGAAQALKEQVVAQKGTLEWLTFRLTQLEHERAQLIFNYMGVKITVPEAIPASTETPLSASEMLNAVPSFDDMGDDAAKAHGIGWNDDGRVIQNGKVIS
jgi:hypothetical protein